MNVELHGTCVHGRAVDKGVVVNPCDVGVEDSGVGEELELSGYERGAASGSLLLRAGHITAVRPALNDKEGGEEGGDDVQKLTGALAHRKSCRAWENVKCETVSTVWFGVLHALLLSHALRRFLCITHIDISIRDI